MISFMPLRTLEFLEVEDKDFVAKNFGTNMPLYRFLNSNTMKATGGAGSAYPSGAPV
jgi:hypothetical protein